MPFSSQSVEEKILKAHADDRLAHAYLLTGLKMPQLEELAMKIAAGIIGKDPLTHPDLHMVRPQSKTRRLTIDQIRALEHDIYLKPYEAAKKVGVIVAVDRMCVGRAEAANAFLKTLEEPPSSTVLLLLSERPESILPTIRSRCLCLSIFDGKELVKELPWTKEWLKEVQSPIETAYIRSRILGEELKKLRVVLEKTLRKEEEGLEDLEDAEINAMVETRFVRERDEIIEALIRVAWSMTHDTPTRMKAVDICQALEEFRAMIGRNVNADLCRDVACLKASGVI